MWSCQRGPDCWKLAPELEAYCFKAQDGAHRRVGLLWIKIAGAISRSRMPSFVSARLCAGRELYFGRDIPPEFRQKGLDEFMAKHCVHGNILNFGPLLDVMERSVVVDQDYAVNYPSPEMSCTPEIIGGTGRGVL